MSKRRPQSESPDGKTKNVVQWICGVTDFPSDGKQIDEVQSLHVLLWIDADKRLLGSKLAPASEMVLLISASLDELASAPAIGSAQRPTHVRVDSKALAAALRLGQREIEVICAPTPEIDEVAAILKSHIRQGPEPKMYPYLSPATAPDSVAALFRAAAAFCRSKPWQFLPGENIPLSIMIDGLDLENIVGLIVGQTAQDCGLLLFATFDDYDIYLDNAMSMPTESRCETPPHLALSFLGDADMPSELLAEISEHGWELAAPNAIPYLTAVNRGMKTRPPTTTELTAVGLILSGVSHLMAEKRALRHAEESGEQISRTYSFDTQLGELEITIQVLLFDDADDDDDDDDDLFEQLLRLADDEDALHSSKRNELQEQLFCQLENSPDAEGIDGIRICSLVMDLAANYYNESIATIRPSTLSAVLFELVPRKVIMPAEDLKLLIDATRALFGFLKRVYAMPQASDCLRVLGSAATKKLEVAFSKSSNFGIGKALLTGTIAPGADNEKTLQEITSSIESLLEAQSTPNASKASKKKASKKKAVKKAAKKSSKKRQ